MIEKTLMPLKKSKLNLSSLRTQVVLSFVVIALIPLLIVGTINQYITSDVLIQNASQTISAAATKMATSLDGIIKANIEAIKVESEIPSFKEYLGLSKSERTRSPVREQLIDLLKVLKNRNPNILSYTLLDGKGNILLSSPPGVKDFYLDCFDKIINGQKTCSSSVIVAKNDEYSSLYFTGGIRSKDGKTIGVLELRYNANMIQESVKIDSGIGGAESFGILFDENYIYLAQGKNPELIFQSLIPLSSEKIAELQSQNRLPIDLDVPSKSGANLEKLRQRIAEQVCQNEAICRPETFTTRLLDLDEKLYRVAVVQLRTKPWKVVFAQPQSVFLEFIRAQTRLVFYVALVSVVIVIIIAIIWGRYLTKPILDLTKTVAKFTAGDLKARVRIKSSSELMTLALSFNRMAEEVSKLLQGLNERTRELQDTQEFARAIERFRAIFEQAPIGVSLINANYRFSKVNEAFCQMLGYEELELLNLGINEITHPEDLARNIEFFEAMTRGMMTSYQLEQRYITKNKKFIWVNVSTTLIREDDNGVCYGLSMVENITRRKQTEAELQKLSLVAAKTDNAVIITNKQGLIEWVNKGFSKITGYTLMEVKGKKPGSFLQGPATNQETVSRIRAAIKECSSFNGEILNYNKNGEHYWLAININPVFDTEGELISFIAIESDITERKQVELELKKQRQDLERLSLVASKTDNAVIIGDKNGLIEWVNNGFTSITGYTLAEVKGKKPGSFLQGPATNKETVAEIRAAIKELRSFKGEILNYTKVGEPYWLSININPVFDKNGELISFVAIESDITERKEVELELKQQREELEKLSLVASKTDNAVIISDKNGLIEWVNNSFSRITGYTLAEVKGKKPGSFLQGKHTNQRTVEKIRESIKAQQPYEGEILNYNKAGEPYWLSININPIFNAKGELVRFIAIESEITNRKKAEVALRYQKEQTEKLLLNILPEEIARRLQKTPGTIADTFDDVTVLFADIVGFTQMSAKTTPKELVGILNVIFSEFDLLAQRNGLEKIKTIGDAYMAVAGLPKLNPNHAQAVAEMALDMQMAIVKLNRKVNQSFNIRIGINTGPVVAGVIGIKKFIYDLWGDTVNVASRMESHGIPGLIHVSHATYIRLKNQYDFEERGLIDVKGKGSMKTYFLTGRL